jgi:hypothetical protein
MTRFIKINKYKGRQLFYILATFVIIYGCTSDQTPKNSSSTSALSPEPQKTLFSTISPTASGIKFNNTISETSSENYFSYNYFYNGGGVAVGDINNDGLADIYFSGNQVSNRLYINKGNFEFEDITKSSGTGVADRWSTGASMVDINTDGWMDLYVCAAGNPTDASKRTNLLFINQKDGTFIEQAQQFGLADQGHTTQAYYLDFDKDNDIDIYVVNHRIDFKNNSKISSEIARDIQAETSDQLYRNDGGKFVNVTVAAGIANKAWGLSASIADYNEDGWPDIYVANDFLEPDMLYINQKNGTFKESAKEVMKHISFYGMGSDVADINNDGLMDLYVLDMVSEDHVRSKRNMASMSNDNFWNMVKYGFHRQYMVNTLQLNNGNGSFSEISNMARTGQTDWSWAPLIADFDLDGLQDIYVTNGIKRDVTDNDFRIKAQKITASGENLTADKALSLMSSAKISNYVFRNKGDLTFENARQKWGLDAALNSNGAAYADLDNDGDLDLIVNHIDAISSIYENTLSNSDAYMIELKGPAKNPQGIGAQVDLITANHIYSRAVYPSRGFMSSSMGHMIISTGEDTVESILVTWSDGKSELISNPGGDKKLMIEYKNAFPRNKKSQDSAKLLQPAPNNLGIKYVSQENVYDDFIKEILLPHKQSEMGPSSSVGDVNGDKLDDLFIGGPFTQKRVLYIQKSNGQFEEKAMAVDGKLKEDVGSSFFDADGDGDLDLYIVCGGNEVDAGSASYQDELLINDGKGNFKSANHLPVMLSSGRCVTAGDYDGDGDMDLYIGGGSKPGRYPESERSYLLLNEKGTFKDVTPETLKFPGIVSSALWEDMNADDQVDLLITGEWMSVMMSTNESGKMSDPKSINESNGWYFNLSLIDINGDGLKDVIAGNIGLNNKFHPTPDRPLHVYFNDFDDNGSYDIVLSKDKGDYKLPVRGRECSSQQMPFITEKFPTYQAFAEANLSTIYGEKLTDALHLEAHSFAHQALLQQEDGSFKTVLLPNTAQRSPMMGFEQVTLAGETYFIYAGNFHPAEVETVRYDAGIGGLLKFTNGQFEEISATKSGIYLDGDVRDLKVIKLDDASVAIVAVCNNGPTVVYTPTK